MNQSHQINQIQLLMILKMGLYLMNSVVVPKTTHLMNNRYNIMMKSLFYHVNRSGRVPNHVYMNSMIFDFILLNI